MRKSWTKEFRALVIATHGTKCKSCGAEGVEYHHSLPLFMGGSDTIDNIMPLCPVCHMIIHGKIPRKVKDGVTYGRPKLKKPDKYEQIIDDYLFCQIGMSEFKERIGMSQRNHPKRYDWFVERLAHKGIVDYRNKVDFMKAREWYKRGQKVGWIEYKNGLIKVLKVNNDWEVVSDNKWKNDIINNAVIENGDTVDWERIGYKFMEWVKENDRQNKSCSGSSAE